jgi:hypothetical protein
MFECGGGIWDFYFGVGGNCFLKALLVEINICIAII